MKDANGKIASEILRDIASTTYDNCLAYIDLLRDEYSEDDVEYFDIIKCPPGKPETHSNDLLRLDSDLNIQLIEAHDLSDDESDLDIAFDSMWFDIPPPFHRVDLLVLHNVWENDIHLVLTNLCTWDSKTALEEGVNKSRAKRADHLLQLHHKRGDITVMGFEGYVVSEDGFLDCDYFVNYLDLDIFDGTLENEECLLRSLLWFMSGEIDESQLLNSYRLVI